jgi:hypothetical protein
VGVNNQRSFFPVGTYYVNVMASVLFIKNQKLIFLPAVRQVKEMVCFGTDFSVRELW